VVGRFGFLRRPALLSVLACQAAVGLALPAVGSADNSQGQNNNRGQNVNVPGRPTAVTCGDTISTPGRYFLAASCGGPVGITITASNVTLKLKGHTMNGPGFGGGVLADDEAGPLAGLKILGPGTITNYGGGVTLGLGGFGVSGSVVRGLTADNNDGWAIRVVLSDHSKVQSNTADNNLEGIEVFGGTGDTVNANTTNNNKAGSGIFLFHSTTGTKVNGNTADNNQRGIAFQTGSTGNTINGNTALGNSGDDLFDGNPGCDSNVWRGNDFGTADPMSCIR
jgi:parallel beta-helix repeat protein